MRKTELRRQFWEFDPDPGPVKRTLPGADRFKGEQTNHLMSTTAFTSL